LHENRTRKHDPKARENIPYTVRRIRQISTERKRRTPCEKWRWNWWISQITIKILIWGLFIKLHKIKNLKNLKWAFEVLRLKKLKKLRFLKPNSTTVAYRHSDCANTQKPLGRLGARLQSERTSVKAKKFWIISYVALFRTTNILTGNVFYT